jgi:hypothetical protein
LTVLRPAQGAFVIFSDSRATESRQAWLSRGRRASWVSTITGGQRTALGVIVNDAK